jgi:hypothetical protein
VFFGFYDAAPPGFTVNSFTPANMVGPVRTSPAGPGCSMPSTNYGPDPYYGLQGEVIYTDPGYSGDPYCTGKPYGCVNSTTTCGGAQAFCTTFTFNVNQMPDSMRVFGVEGGGNPVGGCYPNADMAINFRTFFGVIWGDIQGEKSSAGVRIKWSTLQETNADYYIVERAVDGVNYVSIGQVTAVGNSSSTLRYEYFDHSPNAGENRYRLIQVDKTGNSTDSEIIEVNYFKPENLSWGAVGPNPAVDFIDVSFFSPVAATVTLQMYDIEGRLVLSGDVDAVNGGNATRLDLSKLNRGDYFLSLQGGNAKLMRKVIKL